MATPAARTFDLSEMSSSSYRGKYHLQHLATLAIGLLAIIGGIALLPIIAENMIQGRGMPPAFQIFAAALILGIGVLFLYLAMYRAVPGANRIEITDYGVTFHYPTLKGARVMPWRSPKFWLKLVVWHIGPGNDHFVEDTSSFPRTMMPVQVWRELIETARQRGMCVTKLPVYQSYGETVTISSPRK
jgi:uncharacterized membrane protein